MAFVRPIAPARSDRSAHAPRTKDPRAPCSTAPLGSSQDDRQQNPFAQTGSAVYHPAMNPEALSSMARVDPLSAARVQTYLTWLEQSAGQTPLSSSQVAAGRNIMYMGGI